MRAIKQILLSPYPVRVSNRGLVADALIVLLFVFCINLILNPSSISVFWAILYFLAFSISLFGLFFLTQIITKKFTETNKWLVVHQITCVFLTIFIIIIINGLIGYFKNGVFDFGWLIPALFVAGMSASIVTFIDYFLELRKNYRLATKLNEKLAIQIQQPEKENNYLLLNSKEISQNLKINVEEILFVKASGNYLEIHTESSKELFRSSLKEFAQLSQPYDFLTQTHRSYIVNLKKLKIASGNSKGIVLTLQNCDEAIPVSRSRVKAIMSSPYFHKFQIPSTKFQKIPVKHV